MLIVEGPDLVGKTVLAKKLAKYLNERGWPHIYQHLSRLPECARHDILGMYRRLMNPYTVRDRFHYSEPLYAAMRGDSPLLGPNNYAQVERELLNYEKFLIVVTAEDQLIVDRHKKLGREEMYDLEKIIMVNHMYIEAAENAGYGAYKMPCDLWIHCTADQPFAEIGEHMNLNIYMNRLNRSFHYPGSTRIA